MPDPYSITLKLIEYCRSNNWAGYDPYDALNSEIFKHIPFLNSRNSRLALTQMLKRSPFNFRPLLRIPKTQNPKAIALFLMAFLKLSKLGILTDGKNINAMIEKLIALRSPNSPYWCWGYSFPWQGRTVFVPGHEPNLVCTVFVADALLDAYEMTSDSSYLHMASSAADYIINDLIWTDGGSVAGFCYPIPSSNSLVHNANFLGAAMLCRIYKHCGNEKYIEPALKVARYSAGRQHDDGSWFYGELPKQRWIDNFHTGYNLCALQTFCQYAETREFESHIHRGFKFYRDYFFRKDGATKYFHNHTYPIDIHSIAQSIIT
ncbi:MAG: hypothetical protein ABSB79_15165, partial [Syntrophales bacterium]